MRHTVLLNEAWACIRRGCVIVKHNAAAVVNLASLPTVKSVTVLTYFDEYDAVERSLPVHQYINFIKTFNLDEKERKYPHALSTLPSLNLITMDSWVPPRKNVTWSP